MKKILFLFFLMFLAYPAWGIDVFPSVVGDGASDTAFITFGTMDTTYYPAVLDADSLIILIREPDNSAPDSLANGGTGVYNPTVGSYEVHYATNSKAVGVYRVTVKAWRGGALRGIGTASFIVTGGGTFYYATMDSSRDKAVDGLAMATDARDTAHVANTSALEGKSMATDARDTASLAHQKGIESLAMATDSRDTASLAHQKSIEALAMATDARDTAHIANTNAIEAEVMATNARDTAHVANTNAITANTSALASRDTAHLANTNAIEAEAYAKSATDTINAHAPHDDNWGGTSASSLDTTQIKTMNDNNLWGFNIYKDSLYDSESDSVRSYLATHDSTLLETAAGGASNWSDAQRDSILNAITDANKVNFMRWTAVQRDSILNSIIDANKANFGRWTVAQIDSILNAIEDANKANFKADVTNLDVAVSTRATQAAAESLKTNVPGFLTKADSALYMNNKWAEGDSMVFRKWAWVFGGLGADYNVDLECRSIAVIDSDISTVGGGAVTIDAGASPTLRAPVGLKIIGEAGNGSGIFVEGKNDIYLHGSATNTALKIEGGTVSGTGIQVTAGGDGIVVVGYRDIALDGDGRIHGTIDRATYVDSAETVITQPAGGGVDLSVQVDSLLAALYDRTNDSNFVRVLSQYILKHLYPDSITIDNSNAWDLSGGTGGTCAFGDTIHHIDSILTAGVSCSVTGSNTVRVYVKNSVDSTGLDGFNITIEDSAGGSPLREAETNSSGYYDFGLDNGTYKIYLSSTGWTITSPVYKTIAGDSTLTYYATQFTPSTPPSDSLCVVYGHVKNLDGKVCVNARVEIWMNNVISYHGTLVDGITPKVVFTNASGYYEFATGVYPNDCLTPAGTLWTLRVKTTTWIYSGQNEVPIGASYKWDVTQ